MSMVDRLNSDVISEKASIRERTITVTGVGSETKVALPGNELKAKARSLFLNSALTHESWNGVPIEVGKIEAGDSWEKFCLENNVIPYLGEEKSLSGFGEVKDKDNPDVHCFVFDIDQVKYKPFRATFNQLTGLTGLEVRILIGDELYKKSGGDLNIALKECSQVNKNIGGWCSDNRFAGNLPQNEVAIDPMSFCVVFNHPGQSADKAKGFVRPSDIKKDPFRATLTFNLMAIDMASKLLGIDDERITSKLDKQVCWVAHSRGAAARFFDKGLVNPKIKYALLEPVLNAKCFKKDVGKNLLPFAVRLADIIKGRTKLTDLAVDVVRNLLISVYSGKDHTEVNKYYQEVFDATNKEVIALFIGILYGIDVPNLEKIMNFDSKRHKIFISQEDMFIDALAIKNELTTKFGDSVNACITTIPGDHNAWCMGDTKEGYVDNQLKILAFINNHLPTEEINKRIASLKDKLLR